MSKNEIRDGSCPCCMGKNPGRCKCGFNDMASLLKGAGPGAMVLTCNGALQGHAQVTHYLVEPEKTLIFQYAKIKEKKGRINKAKLVRLACFGPFNKEYPELFITVLKSINGRSNHARGKVEELENEKA